MASLEAEYFHSPYEALPARPQMAEPKPRPWTKAQEARSKDSGLKRMTLHHKHCDWVINEEADTAICQTHGEVVDGVGSAHFPGKGTTCKTE